MKGWTGKVRWGSVGERLKEEGEVRKKGEGVGKEGEVEKGW